MPKKERIHVGLDYDREGKVVMVISNTNDSGLTLADIHNKLVNLYGGGIYAVIVNANSGELLDKISTVTAYDACDLFPQVTQKSTLMSSTRNERRGAGVTPCLQCTPTYRQQPCLKPRKGGPSATER